ncbi:MULTISPECIES: hypothetical protein [Salarchaeum]|uniref:Uncharacterized protein n=1 Tax=Salarchaeum japonicum TaxID=555573 RepID=A0AAV3SZJ0_9EURY|nr:MULTISPECIES: hypothetical protein [Salarchaeum]
MSEYTDIENTGAPAVPDLTNTTDPREDYDETVLSHRIQTNE